MTIISNNDGTVGAPPPTDLEAPIKPTSPEPPADPSADFTAEEEIAEFEALLAEIAGLKDDDTEVGHMDIESYRNGRRA